MLQGQIERTDCNLVLKGGVTSGLVYARAFTILADRYRFAGIAGASAGAIAAAFAACAEYARAGGDTGGFARLEARCEALPGELPTFFQPSRPFGSLMRALVLLAPGSGRARPLAAALCFRWPLLLSATIGGTLMAVIYAFLGLSPDARGLALASPGLVLGLLVGAVAGFALHLGRLLFVVAPRFNFGICTGLGNKGAPALTDWIHASFQEIAFADARAGRALTFGDLRSRGIELKVAVTDLSHGRARLLPGECEGLSFSRRAWARLLPASVLEQMAVGAAGDVVAWPDDLPVLAAVRMSLSCPALIEAVPVLADGPQGARPVLFSDGGLTMNLPLEAFAGQSRPCLALDLDTLHPEEAGEARARAWEPVGAGRPPDVSSLRGFVWGLLTAMREGHGRREMRRTESVRIFQARLTADEGGMNLDMDEAAARRLMSYGEALGRLILQATGGRKP